MVFGKYSIDPKSGYEAIVSKSEHRFYGKGLRLLKRFSDKLMGPEDKACSKHRLFRRFEHNCLFN